jgi:hypothetical protein
MQEGLPDIDSVHRDTNQADYLSGHSLWLKNTVSFDVRREIEFYYSGYRKNMSR